MSAAPDVPSVPPPGHREAFRPDWLARAGWLLLALYVAYAVGRLDFSVERFVTGLDNGERFLARMFPPRIVQPDSLLKGLTESLEIAVLASFAGIVLALPIGLLAARNMMPGPVSATSSRPHGAWRVTRTVSVRSAGLCSSACSAFISKLWMIWSSATGSASTATGATASTTGATPRRWHSGSSR